MIDYKFHVFNICVVYCIECGREAWVDLLGCSCVRAAVYLCKRTMQNKQRLELADYEAENLARLQKTFARKWEFVFMQAEAQAKSVSSRSVSSACLSSASFLT